MLSSARHAARRGVAAGIATCVALSASLPAALAAAPPGNVMLRGKIFALETGEPVGGAVVHALHFDTKALRSSLQTIGNGEYRIDALPFGYYDLIVEFEGKLYLSNRGFDSDAGETLEISLIIGSGQPRATEWWSADPGRLIAGLDRPADGVAWIVEGIPRSVAPGAIPAADGEAPRRWLIPVLAGGGLLLLVGLDGGSPSDPDASPSD